MKLIRQLQLLLNNTLNYNKIKFRNIKYTYSNRFRKNANNNLHNATHNNIHNNNTSSKIIKPINVLNFTNYNNLYGINFYSGSFSIVKDNNNEYMVIFRLINYLIINNKYYTNKNINNKKIFITVNKVFKLNNELKKTSEDKLIIPDLLPQISKNINIYDKTVIGIEDIRIFNYNGTIKIIGTSENNKKITVVTGDYDYENNKITNKKFLNVTFNNQGTEKNWVYFKFNGELKIIYKWFPLQMCNIDNDNNNLILMEQKQMPDKFINARGSTCGLNYNDEIWFIVHTNESGNYFHFFAVFDDNMNLKKYSEKFKFEGLRIEFCIGLEEKDGKLLVCYSVNDNLSKLAVFDEQTLRQINWTTVVT